MKYDDIGKQIIQELITIPSDSASFSNIFDKHFNTEGLYIEPSKNLAGLAFNTSGPKMTNDESEAISRRSSELTILLARYMNLYRFLDEEGLVFFTSQVLKRVNQFSLAKQTRQRPYFMHKFMTIACETWPGNISTHIRSLLLR
jgi:hypothetical protein